MEAAPFLVNPSTRITSDHAQPSKRLSIEDVATDAFFASLASAEGQDDEITDPDCAGVVAAVDMMALELGRKLSARMLAAKSALAQKAQARQAQYQAEGEGECMRLEGVIRDEVAAREAVEVTLAKARLVQHNLADALRAARDDGADKLRAAGVLAEWKEAYAAQRREAWGERIAPKHYRKRLLRFCVGRWRTASRAHRHARIDAFWEQSIVELREALQGHYEPNLAALHADLAAAKKDAAEAWQAKEDLGVELKAAFMRQVCQLNLETASIINKADSEPPVPKSAPPRPIRPEDLLANARRGLEAQTRRS